MEGVGVDHRTRDLKVLVLSTWLPKPCGIATYSHDLVGALLAADPQTDYRVVAINDPGDTFAYPPVVRHELAREDLAGLRRAAAYINAAGADVVSLQHEFGIWGGFDGEFVVRFLDLLRVPVVATFHAVPLTASTFNRANRLRLLAAIGERVAHVVTFLPAARDYLIDALGLPPGKVSVIPHGAPVYDRAQRPAARARLGLQDKLVLTTFGLLSRFKGIADAIRALPPLVAEFPHLRYRILGRPHPYEPAEFYPGLRQLVSDLNLEGYVEFDDRFLPDADLADALLATDVYLTPYHDLAQVSSGTLTFALSAGCCCVSTPYLYAREALADGRGLLVPPSDPGALAAALRELLASPERRAAHAAAGAAYGDALHWPRIGRRYLDTFARCAPPPDPRFDELPPLLLP
jgi:glycosyltransferase involved in cell wall biosynthesis